MATDNSFTYSDVTMVAGKTKGVKGGSNNNLTSTSDEESPVGKVLRTTSNVAPKKISIGPNPNNGNFWFRLNRLDKETVATLFTIDGKQIKQFRVINLQQQQVNNLSSGIYLLKIPGFETQKVIVNGTDTQGRGLQQLRNNLIL